MNDLKEFDICRRTVPIPCNSVVPSSVSGSSVKCTWLVKGHGRRWGLAVSHGHRDYQGQGLSMWVLAAACARTQLCQWSSRACSAAGAVAGSGSSGLSSDSCGTSASLALAVGFSSREGLWGLLQRGQLGSAMVNTAGSTAVKFAERVRWLWGLLSLLWWKPPGSSAKKATGGHAGSAAGLVLTAPSFFALSSLQTWQLCWFPYRSM